MKVLCVLNPLAAGGMALQRWPKVAHWLTAFGLDYELVGRGDTSFSKQIDDYLADHHPANYDAIAGIGGDGTHSAVINGLMRFAAHDTRQPLPPYAFIPLGTGNDIAKSFGIITREDRFETDLRRSVAAIVYGADYYMDLGLINGIYFADALTIGLDSHILKARNVQKRRLEQVPFLNRFARGPLLYTLSSGMPFVRHKRLNADIVVDRNPWYSGSFLNLVINNTRIYAGEFDFSVDAFANDGKLDVVLFAGHKDYLATYILALRRTPKRIRIWSERLHRLASHEQGRHITISLSAPEAAQLDGEELAPADRFDVRVVPRALHIKTPVEPV
jgi:diacylglycerol kinase family enzyme